MIGPREPKPTTIAELTARVVYGAELLLAQVKNKGPRGKAEVEITYKPESSKICRTYLPLRGGICQYIEPHGDWSQSTGRFQ